ncbi:hypothetical protein Mal52_60600 [Symmachiella dynata]|uniref:TIGR00266 family protein n=1 Tax=Symmachiella dynata TaxID=2527995 RepID=A0A517ZYK6_9PLAN|nr:TIGR00266 family protein [Symmachiella dynata]QDU47528.1 hypothetical protein Mal52_60600 [Symmachiella dynata]
MNIEILGEGAFGSALVQLSPGEKFASESGALYRASPNVDIDVTTRSRSKGGFLAGVKRLLAGENFFLSTYSTTDGQSGEVGLAPTHQGEVRVIEADGHTPWMCTGGSYLGSSTGIELDTQFQGLKGFLGGEAPWFIKASGSGSLLVTAFGRITEMTVNEPLTVDTGHVVAFEETLQYTITKVGGSWMQSWLAGEGFVMNFTGQGRILTQSHNPTEFGRRLGPRLPARQG